MDGSFSLELSLQRFLARCPKVGRVRRFQSLVEKVFILLTGFAWPFPCLFYFVGR